MPQSIPLRSRRYAAAARVACGLGAALLAACGSGDGEDPGVAASYTVGGQVRGLASAQGLKLTLNDGTPLEIAADGSFVFPQSVQGAYTVVVAAQPQGKVCTVSQGSGHAGGTDVSDIRVVCATQTFAVSGRVQGLREGLQVTVQNNGADTTTLKANGRFGFAKAVAYDGGYNVTVRTQPAGQTCSVRHGSGDGVTAAVTSPVVVCADRSFTVGGRVSGLTDGQHVTLKNNGGDATVVRADGRFSFAAPVAWQGSYAVTVGTQPSDAICTVSAGRGDAVEADVTSVRVTCAPRRHTVGGHLGGLRSGAQITLHNNGADALTLTADGAFTFATPVAEAGSYAVTVATPPVGQSCSVTQGSGSNVTADVSSVEIGCTTLSYPLGGTLSGLPGGTQITLQDSGGNDLTLTADGAFGFPAERLYGTAYAVTVSSAPAGASCTVTHGSGTVTAAVSNIAVSCSVPVTWLYYPDYGGNQILGYHLNRANGDLSWLPAGGAYGSGADPRWFTLNATGTFGYSVDVSGNSVTPFMIDATGIPIQQVSALTLGATPVAMEVAPNGLYGYVVNQAGNSINALRLDQDHATPYNVGGEVATGNAPVRLAITPASSFVYVVNRGDHSVSAYAIDPATGALTELPGSPYATSGTPNGVTMHRNGGLLYVLNDEQRIDRYAIDASTGALTDLESGGHAVTGIPMSFVMDASGLHGYLGTDTGVLPFHLDAATGALTSAGSAAFNGYFQAMATNAAGTRLYATDFIGMRGYWAEIDAATGALTPGPGSNFSLGARPYSLSIIEK